MEEKTKKRAGYCFTLMLVKRLKLLDMREFIFDVVMNLTYLAFFFICIVLITVQINRNIIFLNKIKGRQQASDLKACKNVHYIF